MCFAEAGARIGRRLMGVPMDDSLSPRTVRCIAALFPAEQAAEVCRLLSTECGAALPFAETLGADGIERIRLAVLKLSRGSVLELRSTVEVARRDWRDVLVAAGFGNDPVAHLAWLEEIA